MNESPDSRTNLRRKLLPLLALAGITLNGWVVSVSQAFESAEFAPPSCVPAESEHKSGNPSAPSDHVALGKDHDGDPSERVLLRAPAPVSAAEMAWRRSLKPREVLPKTPPRSPEGRIHRLLVKFEDSLQARAHGKGSLSVVGADPRKVAALRAITKSLDLRFRPAQTASEASLEALRKRAESRTGRQQPDLCGLIEVLTKDSSPETVLAAANALLSLAAVEYAGIESLDAPLPPPAADIAPPSPSLVSYQTYRQDSQGIGVDFVWSHLGVRGSSSLRITDCEYRFNQAHEDLSGLVTLQSGVASMYDDYENHGTAVLGVIAAGDNGYGMSGGVQGCQVRFYPERASMDGGDTQYRSAAIAAAVADSAPGDIVVLEMQAWGPLGGQSYGPAEYDSSVWQIVKTAVDAGVVIIAAAGNGNQDLDSTAWEEYRDRGDSGAIIVGGGYSNRSRTSTSNYGRRVNLQGWGSGVATTGYGSLATYGGDANQKYTASFNGTSSATAVVASAAALLQSVAIEKLGTRLAPAELRSLLIGSGNPQTSASTALIGPLPDLTAAAPELLATKFSNSAAIVIPDAGQPAAEPSAISVSGVSGIVSSVRVRIDGLSHTDPDDLDILLVGPNGRIASLMSDAGGYRNLNGISLMFDDTAATAFPDNEMIVAGRYRPGNHGFPVESPPPGATGPVGTELLPLAASGPNGEWRLHVIDDSPDDSGSIDSWSISFETNPLPEVTFTSASQSSPENGAPLVITASLPAAITADVTVPLAVSGSAAQPDDFVVSSAPIFIPAGQTTGTATINLVDDSLDEDDETIIVTMAGPTNAIAANLTEHTATVSDNDVSLTIGSERGSPSPAAGNLVFMEGTEINASVTSPDEQGATRYLCTGWTGTGSAPAVGTENATTFTLLEPSSIQWSWTAEHRLEVQTTGSGLVDGASSWHPPGADVALTATAELGHHFVGWTVSSGVITAGSPSSPEITVRMDEPASIVANFAIDTFTLNYLAAANGSISENATQTVNYNSDGAAVLAVPEAGYVFLNWNDGSTQNPRTDSHVVADADFTANFAPIPAGDIEIAASPATPLANDAPVSFGTVVIGAVPVVRSFTVRNTGDAPLSGIQCTLDASAGSAFLLDTAAAETVLAPGAATSFLVSFIPSEPGSLAITLTVVSDDPDEPQVRLILSGTAETPLQAFESWAASEGLSGPDALPSSVSQEDGTPNLLRYAFHLDGGNQSAIPLEPGTGTAGLPVLVRIEPDPMVEPAPDAEPGPAPAPVFRLEYLRRKNSGLIYTPMQMDNPAAGQRTPMTGTTWTTDLGDGWERVCVEQSVGEGAPARFFTVEVKLPDAAP